MPASDRVSQTLTTPDSTIAYRSRRLTSRIRFIRVRQIMTPPPTVSVPPARLVPAPRGTNGTSCRLQSFTTSTTCSVEVGKTTTSGMLFSTT